jgi:AIPR protein
MPHEERDLINFAAALADEVRDRASACAGSEESQEDIFVEIVAEHLSEIGMISNPVVCSHHGRFDTGQFQLNGYAIPDDCEHIDLLVALYQDTPKPQVVATDQIARAASQAARVLQAASYAAHEQMERDSDAYAMIRLIAEALRPGVREVRVFILTDGLSTGREAARLSVAGFDLRLEVYDLRRLMRTMAGGQTREIIHIDLADFDLEPIPCVAMPAAAGEYASYVAVMPGEAVYRLYEEFGPRLLEYNVRAFLLTGGRVNRGIRDTLRDEPHRFMAYNNGISVTVDQITTEQRPNQGLVITGFTGFQVVNGGQTTASIHRAHKHDHVDLSRVYIAAKITHLPPDRVEEMVPKISRYANTQNAILEADFSSIEPFHVAMERLSRSVWCPGERSRWFYERARGQYRTAMSLEGTTPAHLRAFRECTPPSQRITKTDFAKILNSWNGLPHVVSSGTQKNFVAFMRALRIRRGSGWEPDEAFYRAAVAKAILFAAASRVVRREEFPAFRATTVSYLVAYLSHRTGGHLDFETIWKRQAVSPQLEQLLRSWSHPIGLEIQTSAAGRNVGEWVKREVCWLAIKRLDLPLPKHLPPEWVAAEYVSHGSTSRPLSSAAMHLRQHA